MNRQQNEEEKRMRSFVIIGLQELPNGSESEKREQDLFAALDIVRYLGIDDSVSQADVKRARNGPILIVALESIASRDKLLHRAHFLQGNPQTRHIRLERAYTRQDIVRRFHTSRDIVQRASNSRDIIDRFSRMRM